MPDSEIIGSVAGDLVHLLAELLDNALRYSPPISQVRVSAVHTGNGGLVIEVSDIGLGMTESDLRVANTRLQSGGEVTPYTARHMGLFVVGRLAQQHGLVVRLRSTIAGEANSGTTAGVYVPSELLQRAGMRDQPDTGAHSTATDEHSGMATAMALGEADSDDIDYSDFGDYNDYADYGDEVGVDQLNGHSELPVTLLPQRNPGASGISGSPAHAEPEPVAEYEDDYDDEYEDEQEVASDDGYEDEPAIAEQPRQAPVDTSAFFSSREQVLSNGTNGTNGINGAHEHEPEPDDVLPQIAEEDASTTAGADDAIYQRMLSEWLVDPTDLANSSDLNWESVWDHGWSAAEAAEEAPVAGAHRLTGCRCAIRAPDWCRVRRRVRRRVTPPTECTPTGERTAVTMTTTR